MIDWYIDTVNRNIQPIINSLFNELSNNENSFEVLKKISIRYNEFKDEYYFRYNSYTSIILNLKMLKREIILNKILKNE